jgi:hypothetical protein
MSVNVQCVGGGQWYETWEDAEIGADRNVACGWMGQAHGLESSLPYMIEDTRIVPDVLVGRLPCPSCGGRIELIGGAA